MNLPSDMVAVAARALIDDWKNGTTYDVPPLIEEARNIVEVVLQAAFNSLDRAEYVGKDGKRRRFEPAPPMGAYRLVLVEKGSE